MFTSSTLALDHIDFIRKKAMFERTKDLIFVEFFYKIHVHICQISLKTLCQARVTFKVRKKALIQVDLVNLKNLNEPHFCSIL